jgi:hypothetical protein
MKQINRYLPFLKFFWLFMAVHILLVEGEFPEALEESPAVGHTVSSKKFPSTSYLKMLLSSSSENDERKVQEDVLELPDYIPLGLKCKPELTSMFFVPVDKVIIRKEINRPQFNPDRHYPPPQS